MTCNIEPAASFYYWYRNNNEISTRQKVMDFNAEPEYSGNYKCQTSTGSTSEIVALSVHNGSVILQTPLYIYEGDNISLRCFSPPRSPATQTIFYRNNQTIQKSPTNDTLQLKYTDLKATYRCAKQFLNTISRTYSANTTISYTENDRSIPVTITPDWNKLLTGENITMTCNGGNDVTYQWFQNGTEVAEIQTYTIASAQVGHSGIYQCRTSHGDSLPFSLEVSDGPLILQAPIFVYRGRDINIKCHSRPEYSVHWIRLYKNNELIYIASGDLPFIFLEGNLDWSGRYKYLFSKPNITMLYPVTEGDNSTLICDTSLSPIRQGTELQFAFYRNGLEVQEFSSSHQYKVQSTQPKDSGNYFCDVRTPTNSVIKRSEELYFQIQGENHKTDYTTVNIIRLALSGCVLFLGCVFLIHHIKTEVITPSKK